MATSSLPCAVIRMTGSSGYLLRNVRTSSSPSISGISMSVRTTSGMCRSTDSRASSPWPAKEACQPSSLLTMEPARCRSMTESSTTSTVWLWGNCSAPDPVSVGSCAGGGGVLMGCLQRGFHGVHTHGQALTVKHCA